MTIEDLDAVDDHISSPEERDRLLAEALLHTDTLDAFYKQPLGDGVRQGRWKGLLALILLTLAGYVGLAPPTWVEGRPVPQVSTTDRERGAIAGLQLQARQIEVFRARHGRLPISLDELPVRLPGIRFVRSNSRVYQLVAAGPDGRAIVYDSALPDPQFEEITRPWNGGSGS